MTPFLAKNSDIYVDDIGYFLQISLYNTPYGMLNLNIDTKRLKINMNEEGGEIHSKYVIGLDGQEGITTILDIKIQVN